YCIIVHGGASAFPIHSNNDSLKIYKDSIWDWLFGTVELDAMIIDGSNMNLGAIKNQMNVPTDSKGCDTVGAVALDSHGNISCGTSTGRIFFNYFLDLTIYILGGITGKMPGRLGDAALIGCGGYANKFGAASCTGHGESLMKALCCKNVVLELETGQNPFDAAKSVLESIYKSTKSCGGVIALNHLGEIGTFHSAEFMTWASIHSSNG
ncbi:hypothetical protein MXB_1802, partial [Myxobolus squamalis]